MQVISVLELWVPLLAAGAGTLWMAMLAGRNRHFWGVYPFLGLEVLLGGSALVLWMFEVWFVAKALIALGLTAWIALLLGIAIGIGVAAAAAFASVRLVQLAYTVFRAREAFASDLGSSLWLARSSTVRPNDFRDAS